MSESVQQNDIHKAPQIMAELKEGDITMKITKAPKQKKQAIEKEKKEVPYLDDHVQTYGNNLMSSIANLIEQSKAEKPKRKKKVMSPEMLEKCRANLAKGRETIRKKKEALNGHIDIPQKAIEKPQVNVPQELIEKPIIAQSPPVSKPIIAQSPPVSKPIPQSPQLPEQPIRLKYGARLF